MDDTTCTIAQKRFLRGRQTLVLDGDTLKAEYRRGLSLHEYRFDLRGLMPNPMRIRQVPAAKIVAILLAGLLGLVLIPVGIIGGVTPGHQGMVGLAIIGMPLLIFAVAGWIPTAKEWTNVVVFQGPGGRVILWPDLPTKETFDEFLAVLTARIRDAQSPERTVLRRLRQAGIIDDWQYDQAAELLRREGDHPNDW